MPRPKKKPARSRGVQPETVKVIRAASDATLDYELPRARAKQLMEERKLFWDATNGTYCTPGLDKVL